LTILFPELLIQPTLQAPKSPDELNESLKQWFYHVFTESNDQTFKVSYACIDVRDVAAAHVMALRTEAAGGERLIISEGMHDAPPSPVCTILNLFHEIRRANLARNA